MAVTHRMNLNAASFARIKDGSKVIELRLNDAKRQLIQFGDRIVFTSSSGEADLVETEVAALLRYPSFSRLIDDLPMAWFGSSDKEALKKGVYEHYTAEDEMTDGVLGIRIRLVQLS